MIKVESAKIHKVTLTVHENDGELYEWCKTFSALQEIGKFDNDLNNKFFDFLKENTRKYVPYKKVENPYPSFRILSKPNYSLIVAEWHISETETDFMETV